MNDARIRNVNPTKSKSEVGAAASALEHGVFVFSDTEAGPKEREIQTR